MRKSFARLLIFLIILISIGFASQLNKLTFNYVLEDFFPVDDPELAYYQVFEEQFGEDNNYLLLGITPEKNVFSAAFLKKLDSLTTHLSTLPDVSEVRSLTNARRSIIGPASTFSVPVVHPLSPEKLQDDSLRMVNTISPLQSFLSDDGRSTAIFIRHRQVTTSTGSKQLLAAIRSAAGYFPQADVHLAGKLHAQDIFVHTMQHELVIFLSASMVLIIIFLVIAYRSFLLTILPLVIVLISTLWILGIMALAGKSLDILMVLLPTIMFVVGMSDVVHILTKYIEQLRTGLSKAAAIRITLREVGLATFLTSLTTAVGFFTLLTASIRPIREFGIYTGIGVFVAFVIAFTLLPSSLTLIKAPDISRQIRYRTGWNGFLGKAFLFCIRKSRGILITSLLIIIVSIMGVHSIVINTHLIEDLPADHQLKKDFTFFDRHFGGSRPFEMTVTARNDSISLFSPEALRQIEKVRKYLRDTYEVGSIVDPGILVMGLRQAAFGGRPMDYHLPTSDREWRKIRKILPTALRSEEANNFIDDNGTTARISGRVGDIGSAISLEKTKALRDFIDTGTDTTLLKFHVTGTSNLIDKNNEYLAQNMFKGLGIAFCVIALIAGLLFRSFRMIAITLVPNIIPLLMVGGIMGLFGITLKLSTSIVFTIAFGIAVDDTIHFISKLKIELNKKRTLPYALKRTYLSTGKAIIITSIILSGGFLTLLLSDFGGTFYTGLLIGLTLLFALIFDLTLLPILILKFYPRQKEDEKKI